MSDIRKKIVEKLQTLSDQKTRDSGLHFFKESIQLYGVKTALVSGLARDVYAEVKTKTKEEIFSLCEELFASGYMEEAFIACQWSEKQKKEFTKNDFSIFEQWITKYVTNWAVCDTFCNHTMGAFLELYPSYIHELITKWTRSKNRWMKRASAVSLIVPARRGKFFSEVLSIADALLLDPDDMVQKGYGWLLKVASHTHEKEVFEYVILHKATMPRTALRYAIEKMSDVRKKQAMAT